MVAAWLLNAAYSALPTLQRLEDLSTEIDGALAVFCMATYGEGDPTDNAQEFWNILKSKEEEGKDAWDLKGLNFAVFGLGNSTYEYYNTVGKVVDARLEESNAVRIVELGLGDDDGNLEDDYMNWSEVFWAGDARTHAPHVTSSTRLLRLTCQARNRAPVYEEFQAFPNASPRTAAACTLCAVVFVTMTLLPRGMT
jgi:sulfite reductase alpha subunit-like flavoprotein